MAASRMIFLLTIASMSVFAMLFTVSVSRMHSSEMDEVRSQVHAQAVTIEALKRDLGSLRTELQDQRSQDSRAEQVVQSIGASQKDSEVSNRKQISSLAEQLKVLVATVEENRKAAAADLESTEQRVVAASAAELTELQSGVESIKGQVAETERSFEARLEQASKAAAAAAAAAAQAKQPAAVAPKSSSKQRETSEEPIEKEREDEEEKPVDAAAAFRAASKAAEEEDEAASPGDGASASHHRANAEAAAARADASKPKSSTSLAPQKLRGAGSKGESSPDLQEEDGSGSGNEDSGEAAEASGGDSAGSGADAEGTEERILGHAESGGLLAPPLAKMAVDGGAQFTISWYRECGCTGIEIEAVTILVALASQLSSGRVRTNRCTDTCQWSASTRQVLDAMEVSKEAELWPGSAADWPSEGEAWVIVFHAAFLGVCGAPDSFVESSGDSGHSRRILRISRSMAEVDRLDPATAARCNEGFDAVWVPSAFNKRIFAESGVKKDLLHTLPEAVSTELFSCPAEASEGLPPKSGPKDVGEFGLEALDGFVQQAIDNTTFTFLSIFKWEERKNWRLLLRTFWSAFPHPKAVVNLEDGRLANVTVRLLIKTQELSWGTNPESDLEDLVGVLGASREEVKRRMLIVKSRLASDVVPMLYRAADAFVLPTHGEGWGLPLMEAMASGLPTIATGWGGQTEFMNAGNSWLLGYQLAPAPGAEPVFDIGAFGDDSEGDVGVDDEEGGGAEAAKKRWQASAGGEDRAAAELDGASGPDRPPNWADADEGELRSAMWEVLRRSTESRQRVAQACREMREFYSPSAVASNVADLVATLRSSDAGQLA